jgi:hypothetical protein
LFAAQDRARIGLAGIWPLPLDQQCLLANHGNGIGEGEPGCVQEQPPAPQYEPELQPASSAPAVPSGEVDCSDFSSSPEVQPCLLLGDPHRLGADGQACDSLP